MTDTERLDWLETQRIVLPPAAPPHDYWRIGRTDAPKLRDAIDAAIQAATPREDES